MNFKKQTNDVLIGSQGTGKTVDCIKMCIKYLESSPKIRKRILILLPDDSEEKFDKVTELNNFDDLHTFEGVVKYIADNKKNELFLYLKENFLDKKKQFNGLIFCDDAANFLNRRDEIVITILRRRRQLNIFFLWCFHGFRCEMPRSFIGYVNRIYLKYTTDSIDDFIKMLPLNAKKEFLRMYNEVQSGFINNPYITWQLTLKEPV